MLLHTDLSKQVTEMEYAVRGPIVVKAQELERAGREIIYCNIGNPQALKQRPLTWIRQVLACVEYPEIMDRAPELFPYDVRETAQNLIKESKHGLGAYSESAGLRIVREAVADFIRERDSIPADPNAIFLTDGASKGAQSALRLMISQDNDGVMVPIPQYPLYSATLTYMGAHQVSYYLDEKNSWRLNHEKLEEAYQTAVKNGIHVKGIVVINPGNPTGAVLDYQNISMIVDFAKEHNLTILADEVYQDNIYLPTDKFISIAKVMNDKQEKSVTLFSIHSVSKGYLGECGHRGGYLEYRNLPFDVAAELVKLQSVALCSNLPGQIVTYLMVNPPKPGMPSFLQYDKEKSGILEKLKSKALLVASGLNQIPGIECNVVAGAMYAFPKVKLPAGKTDSDFCLKLLEETGICIVPGSGFGQEPGTAHFRTTILPPKEKIVTLLEKLATFYKKYSST